MTTPSFPYGNTMTNKYLEKIAFSITQRDVLAGVIGAGVGGMYGLAAGGRYAGTRRFKDAARGLSQKDRKKSRDKSLSVGLASGALLGAMAMPLLMRGLARGGRASRQKSWDEFRQKVHQTSQKSYADYLKTLRANPSQFKTKAEADRHFRSVLRKAHPDRPANHGRTAEATREFQNLSTARDALHKSEWFQKLAKALAPLR